MLLGGEADYDEGGEIIRVSSLITLLLCENIVHSANVEMSRKDLSRFKSNFVYRA